MHVKNEYVGTSTYPDQPEPGRGPSDELLTARGYQLEFKAPEHAKNVHGNEYEVAMLYSAHRRGDIVRLREDHLEVPYLSSHAALARALAMNEHVHRGGSEWINAVENTLYRKLGLDTIPAAQAEDLLMVVPCIGESMDIHWGKDFIVLHWAPSALDEAKACSAALKRLRQEASRLDNLGRSGENIEQKQIALDQAFEKCGQLIDASLKTGKCALVSGDISLSDDKRQLERFTADLLVDRQGALFHDSIDMEEIEQVEPALNERRIDVKSRDSRRRYVAFALAAILKERLAHPQSL